MAHHAKIRFGNTVISTHKAPEQARRIAEIVVAQTVVNEHPTRALDPLHFKIVTPLTEKFIDQLAESKEAQRDKIIGCIRAVEACIHQHLTQGELRHLKQSDAFARLDSASVNELCMEICSILQEHKLAEGYSLKGRTIQDVHLFIAASQTLHKYGFEPPSR